jgi:transposase-like protein
MSVSSSASFNAWRGFLQRLLERGLDRRTLELVISDEHKGLMDAVEQLLGDVDHELCWAHRMRNVREAVHPSDRSCVVEMLRKVYRADTLSPADRALTDFEHAWRDRYPGVVQSLREDARHLFAFFNAPVEHREYVRTTNPIERTFREVRRWRRGCGAFADAKACDRVFNKVSMLLNERWRAKDLWNLSRRRDQAQKARLQAQRSSEDDAATRVRMAVDPRVFDMP